MNTSDRSTRRSPAVRVCASLATLAVAALISAGPAQAAGSGSSGVEVTNTETVQIYTDATGKIDTRRVYEQLSLRGTGKVDLDNPVSPTGLRNLDGFGSTGADKGTQHVETTVDGEKKLRTVSDYDGRVPLTLAVAYELDGKKVDPADIVGESGRLQVTYTVKNVSAVQQQVSFDDGLGATVTKTVDVPIPIVGSLTTVAPPTFTDVTSGEANMAGDGKGGTKMSFTMTLIPPIGSDTATFGYTADIVDGVVPRAELSALPVDPLVSPSFKTAATSYEGGAQTGVELTGGATEIDSNLLKLRDGAGDLLAGLIQLRDGADQLSDGLVDDAAPGARKLADGAGKLSKGLSDDAAPGARKLADGAGQLDEGLGKLDKGAGTLSAGAKSAADGSTKVADGAEKLSAGVTTLNGKLPSLSDGAGKLAAGQQGLVDGLAKLSAGVAALPASVRQQLTTNASYQQLTGALVSIVAGTTALSNAVTSAQGLTTAANGKVTAAVGRATSNAPTSSNLAGVKQSISDVGAAVDCGNDCQAAVTTATARANNLGNGLVAELSDALGAGGLGAINPTLAAVKGGLSNGSAATCDAGGTATPGNPADDCGISQVAQRLSAGVPVLVDNITGNISTTLQASIGTPTTGCDPTTTLRCAAAALNQGSKDLVTGVGTLVGGVGQLDAGGSTLASGADDLATGLGKISAGSRDLAAGTGSARSGSGKLAAGADTLADGLGDAADGSDQLTAGADKLADGLDTAADGSTDLSDGLDKAADGAPGLVDGAQRLSDEGTQKLVDAGESTAQNYGEMYATLAAGAERANTDDMAVGAPKGAIGLTAYSFVIQGEDGDGGRNLTRGLAGLGLLGAGAGVIGLRRRLL